MGNILTVYFRFDPMVIIVS